MNHIYRVIFNPVLGVWQSVSELAKAKGKSSSKLKTATLTKIAGLIAISAFSAQSLASGGVTQDRVFVCLTQVTLLAKVAE